MSGKRGVYTTIIQSNETRREQLKQNWGKNRSKISKNLNHVFLYLTLVLDRLRLKLVLNVLLKAKNVSKVFYRNLLNMTKTREAGWQLVKHIFKKYWPPRPLPFFILLTRQDNCSTYLPNHMNIGPQYESRRKDPLAIAAPKTIICSILRSFRTSHNVSLSILSSLRTQKLLRHRHRCSTVRSLARTFVHSM